MKKLILALISLVISVPALANYNDVVCSTADQSVFFLGDDHGHEYKFTDPNGISTTYTNREVRMTVPKEWIHLSKKEIQMECDRELGIGLFNVLEDYVLEAEFTKKDGSVFAELDQTFLVTATMLCHRVKRVQGKCQ